jgi:cytochrome c oxidase assembly protein subunit 15
VVGGGNISFQALTHIHYPTGWRPTLFFVLLGRASSTLPGSLPPDALARWPHHLQALTGLNNVVLGWPLIAAVAHTGDAAALVRW